MCLFSKKTFTGHSNLWNLMMEKGIFCWYGASCVLLSLGQSWHRPVWLINLLDWNSQNIRKPCRLLPQCDSFDETASWDLEGAGEAVTYVFNYKDIPFHKLCISCCICLCYLHENPLVSFVTIRPRSTGTLGLAMGPF